MCIRDRYLTHKTVKRSAFLKYKTLVEEAETRRAWYEPTHAAKIKAVSYTHLDVYKRQECGAPWSRRADAPSRDVRGCAPPFSGGGTSAGCPAGRGGRFACRPAEADVVFDVATVALEGTGPHRTRLVLREPAIQPLAQRCLLYTSALPVDRYTARITT